MIKANAVRALSEALKTNTTLQTLNLEREQEESEDDGRIADIVINQQAGNCFGDEGAIALGEALKVNTTLTALKLERESEESRED